MLWIDSIPSALEGSEATPRGKRGATAGGGLGSGGEVEWDAPPL